MPCARADRRPTHPAYSITSLSPAASSWPRRRDASACRMVVRRPPRRRSTRRDQGDLLPTGRISPFARATAARPRYARGSCASGHGVDPAGRLPVESMMSPTPELVLGRGMNTPDRKFLDARLGSRRRDRHASMQAPAISWHERGCDLAKDHEDGVAGVRRRTSAARAKRRWSARRCVLPPQAVVLGGSAAGGRWAVRRAQAGPTRLRSAPERRSQQPFIARAGGAVDHQGEGQDGDDLQRTAGLMKSGPISASCGCPSSQDAAADPAGVGA